MTISLAHYEPIHAQYQCISQPLCLSPLHHGDARGSAHVVNLRYVFFFVFFPNVLRLEAD